MCGMTGDARAMQVAAWESTVRLRPERGGAVMPPWDSGCDRVPFPPVVLEVSAAHSGSGGSWVWGPEVQAAILSWRFLYRFL